MRARLLVRLALRIGHEQPLARRGIDNTQRRVSVLDPGDIHGEIAAAVNKFLCAVQRIDNEKAAPHGGVGLGLLLGHDQGFGEFLPQPPKDQRVGAFVGHGHRAVVVFRLHLEVGALVDLHDHRSGLDRQSP